MPVSGISALLSPGQRLQVVTGLPLLSDKSRPEADPS